MFWNFKNRILSINYKKPSSGLCRKCLSLTNHLFFYIYKSTLNKINLKAKNLTRKKNDRTKKLLLKSAYITVKDQKENFLTHHKCRVINPTKFDIGRICKVKIDRINKAVHLKSKLMQWTNTDQVSSFFIGLEEQK